MTKEKVKRKKEKGYAGMAGDKRTGAVGGGGHAFPGDGNEGVSANSRKESKVLRLRLGGESTGKGSLPLACVQDDGGFGAGGGASDSTGDDKAVAFEPAAQRATAAGRRRSVASRAKPTGRTQREAAKDYWREVKAGQRKRVVRNFVDRDPTRNPLFALSDERRSMLVRWMRDCPYYGATREMLERQGVHGVTDKQIDEFYSGETSYQHSVRTRRATEEATTLIELAEESVPKFSSGMLAALGQEAFRQVASGAVDPDVMARLVKLFMAVRSSNRADQMQELRLEKMEQELEGQAEQALEKLAEEVERHPAAREAFEDLRRELAGDGEEGE